MNGSAAPAVEQGMNPVLRPLLLLAALLPALLSPAVAAVPRTVRVFVALCDNDSQGIAPVPAKIGNGDVPADNLYWGCTDGLAQVFRRSRHWRLERREQPEAGDVLERLTFVHGKHGTRLVSEAWRGRAIRGCLEAFEGCLARREADLAVWIGHNPLMDFEVPAPSRASSGDAAAIVLCCKSRDWFLSRLQSLNARPLLLTSQLMYPGAFLLHDGLEALFAGGDAEAVRQAAAKAYARNQKISVRAALGVFAAPEK